MKTLTPLLFFIALTACNNPPPTPEKISYGSNNGKTISINGKDLYYEEYGKGMPLLVLSGGGLYRSIKDFEKVIPGLAEHFRVILPDTPGQGRSQQPDSSTYESLNTTFSAFIDSLEVDSIYVMGLSDGGIFSILLAERRSDKVKRAIAVGANNGKRGFNLPPGFPLDSVQPMSAAQWEKVNKNLIDDYMKTPGRDWRKQVEENNAMWYADEYFSDSVYQRIKVPVMIVVGDRDDISIEHATEMYKKIRGSELCVLPATSHEVFAESPELMTKVALTFFRK